MIEGTKVKDAHGAVSADGSKDFTRGGGPANVVNFSIVSDELSDGRGGRDIPDGASGVDRRGDNQ